MPTVGKVFIFPFRGGEPTLAGVPFFQHFLESVARQNVRKISVSYSIQTNGLHLSEELLDLFSQSNFLVGLSLDGTKATHDANRMDAGGQGTWNKVTINLQKLQEQKIPVNLLCVVTRACARSPQKVYHNLKKLNCRHFQFIACLDPMVESRGCTDYSLLPEDYGKFLCSLFDCWYLDWKQGNYVSIRLFDDYVHLAIGLPAGTCATSGSCGHYFVVEGDGSVYPCDFYAVDRWKLGTETLNQMGTCKKAHDFLAQGLRRPESCNHCSWEPLCGGGCKRDWIITGDKTENYYCPAFREFFTYAETRLQEIALAEGIMMRRQSMC